MAELIKFSKRQTQTLAPPKAEQRYQYLAFSLGGETFAIDIRSVKEVIQFVALTPVPLMPPFILGVINLRDAVVPVLDLSVRFGRPSTQAARRTCIVILELVRGDEAAVLGIMVDNVSEVLELTESQIEPPPACTADARGGFIAGVGKVGSAFVILLDVQRVVAIEAPAEPSL
jgi:purine-binding chemotaxis protein CheW